jgi:hypothetical protein
MTNNSITGLDKSAKIYRPVSRKRTLIMRKHPDSNIQKPTPAIDQGDITTGKQTKTAADCLYSNE